MAYSSRRDFLITGAALGGAAALGATDREPVPAPVRPRSPNERLRIGVVGCGGKGLSDMRACAKTHDIVALCDVDDGKAKNARGEHPKAAFYHDWRDMLDRERLDAITVSTPDHTHAGPALMAMAKGMHCFVQKPLTHTVAEARLLRDAARKTGVITSMGNQGTCLDGLRTATECVRAGAIGTVREVHVWTNRPIWPQGLARPTHIDPIPASFRWDLWLGPAAWRSFAKGREGSGFKGYAPFHWRGFWDFGTGALGDMACHT
ncbi:MAG: Gfo/Idh/MocA family oxidoreductase, partial [Planctomycetes bacterium]|nr:Gfo/Idh/MocA family oxidoreductase [Planctomycetota bacterium]